MSSTYTPQPDSLASRVVTYFRRLPDEELSSADIALKWQAEIRNVASQLAMSLAAGLLEKDGKVYKAGPNIGRIDLSPSAIARAAEPSQKQPRAVKDIDIQAITFDDDVPLEPKALRLSDQWAAKLRTMRKGQSFPVARIHRSGLTGAATTLKKEGGHFTIRRESGEEYRVFCLMEPGVRS